MDILVTWLTCSACKRSLLHIGNIIAMSGFFIEEVCTFCIEIEQIIETDPIRQIEFGSVAALKKKNNFRRYVISGTKFPV